MPYSTGSPRETPAEPGPMLVQAQFPAAWWIRNKLTQQTEAVLNARDMASSGDEVSGFETYEVVGQISSNSFWG